MTGCRFWPCSPADPRAPPLTISTDCPPFPPASIAELESGDSSPIPLRRSHTVDASSRVVTTPPFPFSAAKGLAVSVPPRPAFLPPSDVGWSTANRHWALFPTSVVGAASVILPSVALPAATAAPASGIPCPALPQVPAVEPPSAPRSPVHLHASLPSHRTALFSAVVPSVFTSLRPAAPPAVAGLLACVPAELLLPLAILAAAPSAPLALDCGLPAAARHVSAASLRGWDLQHVPLPSAPPPLLLLLPQRSRRFPWLPRAPLPRLRSGREGPHFSAEARAFSSVP
ncbi:unnamed protein product [Closterium sp. Naga37s-1]|nr:unnamed protein product [Closterium sp. Naga37s-1]